MSRRNEGRNNNSDEEELDDLLLSAVSNANTNKGSKKAAPQSDKKRKSSFEDSLDEENDDLSNNDEDEVDKWDEDCIGDEEDRRYLFSLPEVEREEILYDRYEKRKHVLEQRELRRKAQAAASAADKNRRTSSTAEADKGSLARDFTRSTLNKSAALTDIKSRMQAKRSKKIARTETTPNEKSDRDREDEESDTASMRRDTTAAATRRAEPTTRAHATETNNRKYQDHHGDLEEDEDKITLSDVRKLQITREELEKWEDEPYFEDVVKNAFVRIVLGERGHDQRVYRLAQVADVINGNKPYKIMTKYTTKQLRLRHGDAKTEKNFMMMQVSNSGVTQSEFDHWLNTMKKHNAPIISKEEIKKKSQKLEAIRNGTYQPTEQEVSRFIEQKRKSRKDEKYLGDRKIELQTKRDALAAENNTDSDEYRQVEKELQDIENMLEDLRAHKMLREKTTASVDVASLNKKNRETNVAKLAQAAVAAQQNKAKNKGQHDPFSRLPTRPESYWFTGNTGTNTTSRAAADGNDADNALLAKKQEEERREAALKSPGTSLAEIHNFDLDLDLNSIVLDNGAAHGKSSSFSSHTTVTGPLAKPIAVPTSSTTTANGNNNNNNSGRKGLSLEDYKRRRGLI